MIISDLLFQARTDVHKNCDHPEFKQGLHVPFQVQIVFALAVIGYAKIETMLVSLTLFLLGVAKMKFLLTVSGPSYLKVKLAIKVCHPNRVPCH